jgi:putative endonuclease
MDYFVYLVECSDNTYYCGITNNIDKRIDEHNNSKKGAKYTKSRRPVILRYVEKHNSRSDALKREHSIKKLSRPEKRDLVNKT